MGPWQLVIALAWHVLELPVVRKATSALLMACALPKAVGASHIQEEAARISILSTIPVLNSAWMELGVSERVVFIPQLN